MEKNRKFLNVLICLIFFLFIYNPNKIFAKNPLKNRVLSLSEKTHILYASSSYGGWWKPIYLIDERGTKGWRSKKNAPLPHIIIFELIGVAEIGLLKFNNNTEETKYPGISAKDVQVEFSTISSDSGYINLGTFTLEKGVEIQEYKTQKTKARWVRLSITSNYGHPDYTELMEFEAWGVFEFKILPIISNFIWILGVAIILAAFSYHEFLAHLQKSKKAKLFNSSSFKKPFLIGMILIATGVSISIRLLWLASISGIMAFMLIIIFFRLIIIQAAEKLEDKD